jgi:hypothetical protein
VQLSLVVAREFVPEQLHRKAVRLRASQFVLLF